MPKRPRRRPARRTPAMPIRPREHELDTEALEYIRSNLPSSWTRQEVTRDYGKDLLIEIFANKEATGLDFIIQSKGHERFAIVHSDQIAQPLRVSTLNYYEKLLQPVLLVAYSAQQKQACCLWIRPYIKETLDRHQPDWRNKDGESEITFHIPTKNVLDQSAWPSIKEYVQIEHSIRNLKDTIFPANSTPYYKLSSNPFATSTSSRLVKPRIQHHIHRARLTDKLTHLLNRSSVFIRTDAGYGKTWFLYDFVVTTNPQVCVWYTCGKEVFNARNFIEEISAELTRRTANIGNQVLAYFHQCGKEAKLAEAVAILIEEIASSETSTLLIIDDVYLVTDSETYTLIETLITKRPDALRIVITSRLSLPFGEARLVAQNLLTVINQNEIAFHLEETQEFIKETLNLELPSEHIEALHQRTDGWIAPISLAANALQGTNPTSINGIFTRLTGFHGNIYTFFAEEVYSRLNDETRWLLKRLGLVNTLEPNIANLFTGRKNGGQILKDLTKRNTFLVEHDNEIEGFRLHALFREFLETRLRDEEGEAAVVEVHTHLAHYYANQHEWYRATDHAIEAHDFALAIQGLEIIAPTGVNLGYGQMVLELLSKIPPDKIGQSANLQEVIGLASLQTGDFRRASEAFQNAQELYRINQDNPSLNRIEYLLAEVGLANGSTPTDSFIRTANKVAMSCYKVNDAFFGAQAELRVIEMGQTLTYKNKDLLPQLIERSDALVMRLQQFDNNYDFLKARAFAAQAHLLFQIVSDLFGSSLFRINVRLQMGHPISESERIGLAKAVFEGLQNILDLYGKAESLVRDKNEIAWAHIRLQHITDHAHQLSMFHLIGSKLGVPSDLTGATTPGTDPKSIIRSFLPAAFECAKAYAKYHMGAELARAYCDIADIQDIVGDSEARDNFAQKALELSIGLDNVKVIERAQKILRNESTFSALRAQIDRPPNEKDLVTLDEAGKKQYMESFLRAYAGDANVENMREAIKVGIDDMVAKAKQKTEWCRYVEIIEDLSHTRSKDTFYRQIPKKWIICMLLGHKSPNAGYSFDALWPMFKGVYCLGCLKRSLAEN